MRFRSVLVLALLTLSACEQPREAAKSTPPAQISASSPASAAPAIARRVTLTRAGQLPVDEGSNAIALESSTGTAYVVTYAGDSVTAVSAQGNAVARYVLPEAIEFGTLISAAALADSTLFLPRTRINRLALLDIKTGKTLKQLTPDDLGVAAIISVVAGGPGHVFVLAAGPLPKTPPVIAEVFILELDSSGAVVRRATMAPRSGEYPAYAWGAPSAAYDRSTDTLLIGLTVVLARVGAIAALGPGEQQARELFATPEGARMLAADVQGRRLYVASEVFGAPGRTRVEVHDIGSGATSSTAILDFELAGATVDEQSRLLFATARLRGQEADQLLAFDSMSLTVLAQAEIPWDPAGHGLAVDPTRAHVFVSSRVRPASATTFAYLAQP